MYKDVCIQVFSHKMTVTDENENKSTEIFKYPAR